MHSAGIRAVCRADLRGLLGSVRRAVSTAVAGVDGMPRLDSRPGHSLLQADLTPSINASIIAKGTTDRTLMIRSDQSYYGDVQPPAAGGSNSPGKGGPTAMQRSTEGFQRGLQPSMSV